MMSTTAAAEHDLISSSSISISSISPLSSSSNIVPYHDNDDETSYACIGSPLILTSPENSTYLCDTLAAWSSDCMEVGGETVCCSGVVQFAAPGAYHIEGAVGR